MKSDKIVKPTHPKNAVYRTINNHSWLMALLVSVALHGMFVLIFFLIWPSASSKGQGQVMLLEAVHEHTSVQPNTQAQQASVQSIKTADISETVNIKGKQTPAKAQSNKSRPQQTQRLKTHASSSNKGALLDQSGKTQTPQEAYQQALLKHLLNKMGSAPVTGKAKIDLTLMSAGIAIQVKVNVISGSVHYQQWLQSKVLNANPFPVVPKELGTSQFSTSIPIEHSSDQ